MSSSREWWEAANRRSNRPIDWKEWKRLVRMMEEAQKADSEDIGWNGAAWRR